MKLAFQLRVNALTKERLNQGDFFRKRVLLSAHT